MAKVDIPEFCVTRSLVRVRFCDTDMMGVVHHSNYIKYFELARIEYLRRRGLNYSSWVKLGLHLPVIGVEAKYKTPSFLDDLLTIEARLSILTRVKVGFDYRVLRKKPESDDYDELAHGHTLLACVDNNHRPVRMSSDAEALILSPELQEGELHL
ncbi:MAG: acyl-CoA thioesterase [Polyangiaceae bacterium]|nr:acyl-CoA thioesterase [Polyangiaceae bacterium]